MAATPTTQENLKEAFAGESQANRKYLAYAAAAEKDGFKVVAKLFRAAAEAETVHALGHLHNMGGVKSTRENLEDAIAGETHEYTTMYPPMVAKATEEKHKGKTMLAFAEKAEKVHADLYTRALEAVKAGHDLEEMEFWYCPVCGYVECGKTVPAKCPICGAPGAKLVKI